MPLTLKQFAAKGGKARAAKLSSKRRIEIAKLAGQASALQRQLTSKSKADASSQSNEKIDENKV